MPLFRRFALQGTWTQHAGCNAVTMCAPRRGYIALSVKTARGKAYDTGCVQGSRVANLGGVHDISASLRVGSRFEVEDTPCCR
jgi:hypothetical protein